MLITGWYLAIIFSGGKCTFFFYFFCFFSFIILGFFIEMALGTTPAADSDSFGFGRATNFLDKLYEAFDITGAFWNVFNGLSWAAVGGFWAEGAFSRLKSAISLESWGLAPREARFYALIYEIIFECFSGSVLELGSLAFSTVPRKVLKDFCSDKLGSARGYPIKSISMSTFSKSIFFWSEFVKSILLISFRV